MDFEQLIMKRQACREYSEKPVERDKIEKIAEMAHYAPSARNSQPWKLHVVTGDMAKKIGVCLRDMGMNEFTKKVSSYIVVSEFNSDNTLKTDSKYDKNHFVKYDIGELVAYLTLSAEELGVQSCIIGWLDNEKIASLLNFDKNESCNIVVALGYSDTPLRNKKRKELNEIIEFHE